jgi:hypothetical protein
VVTFYKNRGLRITDQWLVIDDRYYPLRDLAGVQTTRGPVDRLALRAFGTGASLVALAVLLVPALPVAMTAVIGLAGLAALGTAFAAAQLRPRQQVVWAEIGDSEIELFATTEEIEVGKLLRSLRRAIEYDARFLVS